MKYFTRSKYWIFKQRCLNVWYINTTCLLYDEEIQYKFAVQIRTEMNANFVKSILKGLII